MDFAQASTSAVLAQLKTSRQGLNPAEAAARLGQFGPNLVGGPAKVSLLKILLEPFKSAFVIVLLGGGAVSWLVGHRRDTIVIGLVILINALIEWGQQASAAKVLASLRRYGAKIVKVRRQDQITQIDSSQVVPGDIVLLGEGEKVPADGRLIEANELRIDESALTGESLSVNKSVAVLAANLPIYQQTNMVFAGTSVESGRAVVCVTATGRDTEFGKIAALSTKPQDKPPIVAKVKSLTLRLILGTLVIGLITVGLGLAQGQDLAEVLRFGVALVVSVIPEGLPVTLTIILLLGVKRMAKKQAFVRNLPAVETLGMVTAIATDKTGTLTQNQMAISKFWDLDGSLSGEDNVDLWLSVSHRHPDLVHPIEKLITAYSENRGAPSGWKELSDLPFEVKRRFTVVAWRKGSETRIYIKGAPEEVIKRCRLTADQSRQILRQLAHMTAANMRVIAVAKKTGTDAPTDLKLVQLKQMDFEGLIGLRDELRPEAKEAVAITNRAGIKVYMLTGDHLNTAQTIGQEVGIGTPGLAAVAGEELVKADSSKLRQLLKRARVFGRVLPEHKFRLLEALKQTEITAMTGDGVNDAPALAKADVGIAMGSGTDVAKEAGDIVLLDNNYRTIVEAIAEGRRIYANVRKIIYYQLSTNLAEALAVVGGLVLGLPLVMTAAQVLWLNLVTDTTMIIPLGLEPAEAKQMRTPPRRPTESLLSKPLLSRLMVTVVVMAASSIFLFNQFVGQDLELARTMAFLSLCAVQWAAGINSRSEYGYSWQSWRQPNFYLLAGIIIGAALIALAVYGPLQTYIGTVSVAPKQLLVLIIPFVVTLLAGDIHKWIINRRAQP